MKFLLLIFKNVRRNLVRSALTALGTMVLVSVVTLFWSVLALLDLVTAAKSENLKAIVTERWSAPSLMPFSYAATLAEGAARRPGDARPADAMSWQFYAGTLDPTKLTRESMVFTIAVDPRKILTMMDGIDTLSPAEKEELQRYIDRFSQKRDGLILGRNHLINTNKRVGERIKLSGVMAWKGLDLEFEIIGAFPAGRYDTLAAMHSDYYNNAFDAYARNNRGRKHPLADRNLSLMWLKVPDMQVFGRVASQIEQSPLYRSPAVKCETASSGFASFLEPFRDLIWAVRWLLAPACLVTVALVIAIAISISVRERHLELAVLKVLGFRPGQILLLVLGEAVLLGTIAGLGSAALTYAGVNWWAGGLKFPLGFFDRFMVPTAALWWGAAMGGGAALAGSILPAWSARNVKVAEVFSKVA